MSDKNAANHKINAITKEVACNFPKDNPEKLAWFKAALQDNKKKWFVAKVIEKIGPIPKALLSDLVLAAMLEQNASSNKLFIIPCVNTFGKEKIKEIMLEHATNSSVIDNEGYNKVAYWVGLKMYNKRLWRQPK